MKQNDLDKTWLREMRHNLAGAPLKAPADGWERISASLQTKTERHSIRNYVFRAAAVIALVFMTGIGYEFLYKLPQHDISEEERFITGQETANQPVMMVIPEEGAVLRPVKSKREEEKISDFCTETDSTKSVSIAEIQITKEYKEEEPSTMPAESTLPNDEEAATLLKMENQKDILHTKPWSFAMNAGRSLGLKGQEMNQSSWPGQSGDNFDQEVGSSGLGYGAPALPIEGRVLINARNHWSWNFGFSVRRQLTQRFAIETGINYTQLSSDVTLGHPNDTKIDELSQKSHYIGIPLSLNIMLIERNTWQLYASTGGSAERCIAAYLDDVSFSINAWQWSINGALGGQYSLSKHLGVFLEPTINYYFDDHTNIPSIRKERPCNFNLRLGLRMSY